ncbi:MAG: glycosyltransferase [Clostridia bacterium]|nr:glycosyltransferase [Clostridia bacterium]
MKILIISYESWREGNNGGNVLSNMFCAFPEADIAQIYCSGEPPQNSICRKYFQISDSMLMRGKKGRRLEEKDYSAENTDLSEVTENNVKSKIPGFLKSASMLAREMLWVFSDWKTKELEGFIKDFAPDIIFAPCYSFFHVSKLALYVKSIAGCPMISYISDDNYSIKQLKLYPSFFINRLITRKWIRRLFKECSLVYTMTELQKTEYEALLGRPMKVLCKSAEFEDRETEIGDPVQIIYAGGLYLNRWKVLCKLVDALEAVNAEEIKAQLHIYSGSKLSEKAVKKLNNGRSSVMHAPVPFGELSKIYRSSDVAVHVESFDLKNRLITRLSFSTKIIDCMNSGCAVLAIGPEGQAGIAYLKDNDAAICVGDINSLPSVVQRLANDSDLIKEYSAKAIALGKRNHIREDIEKGIREDFYSIAGDGR